jgi:hypothetical protein
VASPSIRAGVSHFSGATDEEKAAVELVAGHALAFEDGIGTDFRERCNRFYGSTAASPASRASC